MLCSKWLSGGGPARFSNPAATAWLIRLPRKLPLVDTRFWPTAALLSLGPTERSG